MSAPTKILIVDDNPMNVEVMEEILTESFDVEIATTGEAALEKAGECKPDIVLLDIMMPGIDGYEVCRRLRKRKDLRHTKIILVSAKAMITERLAGYEAGADDYLTKPFDDEELEAKVKVFARLKTAEEVNELRSSILNLLRHQTRTPLTGILSPAEMLIEDLENSEHREWAQMILRSGKKLHTFLERGTLLCGYKSGSISVRMESCNLNILVTKVLEEMRPQAEADQVQLEFDQTEVVWVSGNPDHLKLVVRVLVDNAIRFSGKGGTTIVQVDRDGDSQGILRVIDHGPGIQAEMLERVFDGFVVEDLDHHSTGSGLSLALSRAVVRHHSGEISAKSQPGKETCFSVSLPLEVDAAVMDSEPVS